MTDSDDDDELDLDGVANERQRQLERGRQKREAGKLQQQKAALEREKAALAEERRQLQLEQEQAALAAEQRKVQLERERLAAQRSAAALEQRRTAAAAAEEEQRSAREARDREAAARQRAAAEQAARAEAERRRRAQADAAAAKAAEEAGRTTRIDGPGDIGYRQYYGSKEIKEALVVGGGVPSIGEEAFYKCTQLKSVVLEDGVRTIDHEAFDECSALASVSIPDSVTKIEGAAFRDTALTAVSIPAAATYDDGSRGWGASFPSGCVVTRHTAIAVKARDAVYRCETLSARRSKCRLVGESKTEWRDELVNLEHTAGNHSLLVEIQIVRSKMLLQRASMGGHDGYDVSRGLRGLYEVCLANGYVDASDRKLSKEEQKKIDELVAKLDVHISIVEKIKLQIQAIKDGGGDVVSSSQAPTPSPSSSIPYLDDDDDSSDDSGDFEF
eukprot:gene12035-2454_t